MAKMPEKLSEQRKALVERIIEDMKAEGASWTSSWEKCASPRNPLSGTVYRGGNKLILAFAAMLRGYSDPRWVTFDQAKKAGWKIRKGAKAVPVEKWKALPREVTDEDGETQVVGMIWRCVGHWNVFNASEFENAPEFVLPQAKAESAAEAPVDALIESSRCPVREVLSDRACYMPALDEITMPLRAQFESIGAFARVLMHEMAHSTGHSSALDRKIENRFGDEDYAFEELVAELGSVFVAAEIGVELSLDEGTEHHERHVAYIKSWLERLGDDPDMVFRAASAADKAAELIVGRYAQHLSTSMGAAA